MPGKRRLPLPDNQPTLKVFFGRRGCPSPPLDFSRESNTPLVVFNPPESIEQILLALGARVLPADHWKLTYSEAVDNTFAPQSPSWEPPVEVIDLTFE